MCGVKTYDFKERLEFSHSGDVVSILQKYFSAQHCIDIQKTDIETDKKGIDYIVKLDKGAEIGIDVKRREKGASRYWQYGEAELAIENWSVCPPNGKIGWSFSRETNVDYILYVFDKSDCEKSYLLPFQLLRMAARANWFSWSDKYLIARQSSGTWESEAMFVPASVLLKAIVQEMSK